MTDSSNNIPEDREVDQGLPIVNEAQDQPANNNSFKDSQLSMISCKYDIDGDGQLDEAELAMRNMEKSGRGNLINEQVHSIMLNHMDTQREFFKVKKVVMWMLAFVVFLMLSNIIPSITISYLVKDTTTSDKDELVNSNTGEAVTTQITSDIFSVSRKVLHPNDVGRERRLACVGKNTVVCDTKSYLKMDEDTANNIMEKCNRGKIVMIRRTFVSDPLATMSIQICPADDVNWSGKNSNPASATIKYANDDVVTIMEIVDSNGGGTGVFVIDGDRFTQDEGQICDVTGDCDNGLDCIGNACAAPATTVTATTVSDGNACDGTDIVCEAGSSCFIATDSCFNPPCGTCVDSCEDDSDCHSWSSVCYDDSILGTDKDGRYIKTCGTCDPADTNLPASGCTDDAAAPACIQGFGRGQCGCDPNDSSHCPGATCTSLWCKPALGDIVNSCLTDGYILNECGSISAPTTEAPRVP